MWNGGRLTVLDSEIGTSVRDETLPPRRRPRRRMLIAGTAALAVGAVSLTYVLRDPETTTAQTESALPTVSVARETLANVTEVDGSLGYASSFTLLAAGSGRITWLPAAGDAIKRGKRAYALDGHSVPLFYGSTPLWRDLQQGMTNGVDVLEVEQNLDALGYDDGLTVDREFTWRTAEAIRDWQEDRGITRTGVLTLGDVVVQPGSIRVTKIQAVLGAPATGTVYTASGVERRVTVNLPVNRRDIAKTGAKVRITLPGEKTATGRVTSIGKVATAGSTNAQSQTGQGTETATIPVYITLDKAGTAADFDGAPVTVGFTGAEHKDVLSVPINALLASAEGAYSVNAVDAAGKVRSVPVKLGIFDGDNVEVSGDLTAGTKVQVPRP